MDTKAQAQRETIRDVLVAVGELSIDDFEVVARISGPQMTPVGVKLNAEDARLAACESEDSQAVLVKRLVERLQADPELLRCVAADLVKHARLDVTDVVEAPSGARLAERALRACESLPGEVELYEVDNVWKWEASFRAADRSGWNWSSFSWPTKDEAAIDAALKLRLFELLPHEHDGSTAPGIRPRDRG